jgi:predicted Zn-dependent peptidase
MMTRTILTASLLLLLTLIGVASVRAQSAPQQIEEFDVNGLKVIVKQRPGAPTVAAGLYLKGGTRSLDQQKAGLENYMLSVAVEGSVAYPRAVLRRELAKTGSVISVDSGYDYSVLAITSTAEYFPRTWKIFSDVAMNPAFAVSDVQLTRSALMSALQSREDNPDSSLQILVDRTILGNSTYTDPNGTLENIGRFTAADLTSYHKSVMATSRLMLVVVGNVDPSQVKQMVRASLGKLPPGHYMEPAVPTLDFSKPTVDITPRALQTNYINGIFAAPAPNHPDYFAMNVAISILSNRVFEEVRVKRNLSYAPSANLGSLAANTGAIYVTAVDANGAVRVMLDEIKRLQTEPVDTKELAGIAGFYLTNHYLKQETNAKQVADLAEFELIGGGWQNSLKFLDEIRKVRAEDIRRVAKLYMKNLRFMVVGDPKSIDRSIFLQNQQ